MTKRNLMFAIAIGLATLASSGAAWSDDADQAAHTGSTQAPHK